MARHRAPKRRSARLAAAALGVAVVAGASAVMVLGGADPQADLPADPQGAATAQATPAATTCGTTLRIVTASSFEPVLADVAALVATGEDCARLEVEVADGRAAEERAAEVAAHLWIPDDTAWAGIAGTVELDPDATGAGTVVATSPIYLVTDEATAEQVQEVGGSWLGLAELLTSDTDVRLVVRDPAGSGDGLVAAGAVGEAVWLDAGMDASAEVLMTALPSIRTVSDHAVPDEDGEIGLVPEHALVALLTANDPAAARLRGSTMLTGADASAVLRYTWLPTSNAAEDPALGRALDLLLSVLTGPEAAATLGAAGLRDPESAVPPATALPAGTATVPVELEAAPFDVLIAHAVEHVFSTWYAEYRRSDVLLVIDISGSMAALAAGSNVPPLDATHREALVEAAGSLAAINTGTGLYDTTLAAYLAAQDSYRDGTPNQAILFTDGRNEDRPGSITEEQLSEELAAAHDPERPVQLSVITFGTEPEAQVVATALEPVEGYVAVLTTAQEVLPVFIHLAAGGRH